MKLDRHSSIPLYAQLKKLIADRIEDGTYKPGDKIPTELELCDELELSRPTVRQAIAELVSENMLTIMKGKGTYVTAPVERVIISGISAFTFSFLTGKGLEDKQFVDYPLLDELPPEQESIFAMNTSGNDRGFYEVSWTEGRDDRDYVYCKSYIPGAMFPNLGADIKSRSNMLDITANKYPFLPNRANWRIYVRTATTEESRVLDLSKGAYVLVSESVFLSRSGNISESSIAVLNAESCELQFETTSLRRD